MLPELSYTKVHQNVDSYIRLLLLLIARHMMNPRKYCGCFVTTRKEKLQRNCFVTFMWQSSLDVMVKFHEGWIQMYCEMISKRNYTETQSWTTFRDSVVKSHNKYCLMTHADWSQSNYHEDLTLTYPNDSDMRVSQWSICDDTCSLFTKQQSRWLHKITVKREYLFGEYIPHFCSRWWL